MNCCGFSLDRVGPLKISDGIMNLEKYKDILESHCLPYLETEGNVILQEENAPCHKSVPSKNSKVQKDIENSDWAAYSPDLNPI